MNRNKTLKEVLNGDQDAFKVLMHEYYDSLISFVYYIVNSRESAEEIVQDVFVNVWINRSKISLDTSIRNYLYVSARNFAYNHIRNTKRLRARLEKIAHLEEEDTVTEAFMIEEDAISMLENAIGKLPPRTANILRMSLQGMKREEIAKAMNVTVSNVKNLKAIGIKKLRTILELLLKEE